MRGRALTRIAVYPGATSTAAVKLFLKDTGVDPNSVKFRPLPPPEHLLALERGDVDASHLYEPMRTKALAGRLCREIVRSVYARLNSPSAIGVSAVSSRLVQKRPKVAARYFAAWDRSVKFIREQPEKARAILRSKLGLSSETATAATWVDATLWSELDQAALRATLESIARMGMLPSGASTDPSPIIHPPR